MTMREAELKIADELEYVAKLLRKKDAIPATKKQAEECLFDLHYQLTVILSQVK